MLDISLLSNMSNKGLSSVVTIKFWHHRTNILAFSSDHDTARAFPSIGQYQLSVGVKKQERANTSLHPSEKQTGAWSFDQLQCF